MVVFINGFVDKFGYRKFIIKKAKGQVEKVRSPKFIQVQAKILLKSSSITYIEGISRRVIKVANITPHPRLIAMGTRNRAWVLFSRIIGINPKKVVKDVSIMGLILLTAAFITAS